MIENFSEHEYCGSILHCCFQTLLQRKISWIFSPNVNIYSTVYNPVLRFTMPKNFFHKDIGIVFRTSEKVKKKQKIRFLRMERMLMFVQPAQTFSWWVTKGILEYCYEQLKQCAKFRYQGFSRYIRGRVIRESGRKLSPKLLRFCPFKVPISRDFRP